MATATRQRRRTAERDGLEQLLAGYRPLPGIFDEMMDADGRVRPHWQPFLSMLAALGTDEINRRFAAADRHLRDSGVFYRVYEDPAGAERPWPLSHVPLLIDPAEWAALKRGLVQRAELLEAVLADVYGPATLVRDGRLPAALIAGNPEFLRPLVGVDAAGRRASAVLRRRCRARRRRPLVGAGRPHAGAVGRRLRAGKPARAVARHPGHLSRHAGSSGSRRSSRPSRPSLSRFNRQDDSRVCLLTPGPMNETYFEHAYLARYLGFLLVEGEDLTVRDDGVFIRTVSGLQARRGAAAPARCRLRRSAGAQRRARASASPGLVQAVRDGKVVIANALGAGLVEARAMLAFLPALAPAVLGADLAIPNVATWWLGHAGRARRDRSASSTRW